MQEQSKLYVVFGATGRTGKEVLPRLLAAGHLVRAYVRHPEKIHLHHDRLEIVKGDIRDVQSVKDSLVGAFAVISMVGHALGDRTYKGGLLLPFIKALHTGMKKHNVKRLLVQSGAMAVTKNEPFSLFKRVLLRQLISRLIGDHGVHVDNDEVLSYLENNGNDIDWIVTRPPTIVEDSTEQRKVAAFHKMPFPPKVTFHGLAIYTLEAINNDALIHTAKYCGFEK
ncbi:MAG: NAD(P)H-binding protein [Bermanella sp.]